MIIKKVLLCSIVAVTTVFISGCSLKDNSFSSNDTSELVKYDTIRKSPLFSLKKEDPTITPTLMLSGIRDLDDLNNLIKEYGRMCEKGDSIICNQLGRHYYNEGDFRNSYKFYSVGCKNNNPYGCGMKNILKSGAFSW